MARRRLPRAIFEFMDRGAEDELSLAGNRRALERINLMPRYLRGCSERSTGTVLFGQALAAPIIVAPTGVAGLISFDGEAALARASSRCGIPYTSATYSLASIESVAQAVSEPVWFQLYMWERRDASFDLMARARSAGCKALVLTIDSVVPAKREYNTRNGFSHPFRLSRANALDLLSHPGWLFDVALRTLLRDGGLTFANLTPYFGHLRTPPPNLALDWDHVRDLRERWPDTLILKGVLHPDDAVMAADLGVDGIVVSNHGGRSADGLVAPADILPEVAAAVDGRLSIIVDGGIRRGSDVVRALALGADAVMVGRLPLYGLASGGEDGATGALSILIRELDSAMAILGLSSIDQIDRQCIRPVGSGCPR